MSCHWILIHGKIPCNLLKVLPNFLEKWIRKVALCHYQIFGSYKTITNLDFHLLDKKLQQKCANSLAASQVEKLNSSAQELFRGTLQSKIPAPPGFSLPNRAPPPGFSSQERYEHAYSSFPDNSFHGSLLPNQFELHSIRNAGDVEFIDPAILAVGKGIHPLELNNSGLGSAFVIPPQFSSSEGKIKMQSSSIHDSYISSRFPEQINTNYSPFIHRQQLTTPNILNNQWSGWQNEQFGHDNFILINNEHKFMLSSSNGRYVRPYGM